MTSGGHAIGLQLKGAWGRKRWLVRAYGCWFDPPFEFRYLATLFENALINLRSSVFDWNRVLVLMVWFLWWISCEHFIHRWVNTIPNCHYCLKRWHLCNWLNIFQPLASDTCFLPPADVVIVAFVQLPNEFNRILADWHIKLFPEREDEFAGIMICCCSFVFHFVLLKVKQKSRLDRQLPGGDLGCLQALLLPLQQFKSPHVVMTWRNRLVVF